MTKRREEKDEDDEAKQDGRGGKEGEEEDTMPNHGEWKSGTLRGLRGTGGVSSIKLSFGNAQTTTRNMQKALFRE